MVDEIGQGGGQGDSDPGQVPGDRRPGARLLYNGKQRDKAKKQRF